LHFFLVSPFYGFAEDFMLQIEESMNHLGDYDVIVIGAGHAGIEAAHAAAMLGAKTAVFTMSLDAIGNMPCNPSIGGTAKGTLVRELDALGGVMGLAADATYLQSRMLNKGKGPAVHALRVQTDRKRYHEYMKHALELTPGLAIHQAEIISIEVEDGHVKGVVTQLNGEYGAKCVVIATGTNLGGKIFVGDAWYASGPDGMHASLTLTDALKKLGLPLRRFKTGTPPRVNARSVDFSQMEVQTGDKTPLPFSFSTEHPPENQAVCYLTYTTEETHRVIRENLDRSPIYSGVIEGVGPRYCPSIETKIVRFPDKPRHQLFIEPMGLDTEELYIQGFSSSMPEEVQIEMLHSVKGLEHAEMMRPAYAIEYDCIDPTALYPTLEYKHISGLYGAGQFNGSSGYEEAAVQGFVAGVNAARKIKGESPFILGREQAYIGTLIDDLVTKGTNEPYRMMTSRSEYRLILRQDNADERLAPIGHELGLVSDEALQKVNDKYDAVRREIKRLEHTGVPSSDALNALLTSRGTAEVHDGSPLIALLRRPQLTYDDLRDFDAGCRAFPPALAESVEIAVKYEGYIRRQMAEVAEFARLEHRAIPEDIDYAKIDGLRLEAREKLAAIRPQNLGQAGRISGVSPADVAALMLYITSKTRD